MSFAFWPLIERKHFRIFALVQSALLLVSLVAASFVAGFSTIAAPTSGSQTNEAASHANEQSELCPRPVVPDDGESSRWSEACVKAAFSHSSTYVYDAVLSSAKSLSVERGSRRLEDRHRVLDRRISPGIQDYDARHLFRVSHSSMATNTVGAVDTGINKIYTSVDPVTGEIQYVGRTNDIARRGAEHLSGKGIQIQEVPGLGKLERRRCSVC